MSRDPSPPSFTSSASTDVPDGRVVAERSGEGTGAPTVRAPVHDPAGLDDVALDERVRAVKSSLVGPSGIAERRALAALEATMFGRKSEALRVDRYVLETKLGSGGAGVVYEAHDPQLDRRVAIKLVHPTHAPPRTEARMVREARTLARLAHRHIVRIYDVGTYAVDDPNEDGSDRGVYIVMELVEGLPLHRWLLARDRDWRTIVEVFLGAAQGLAAAHRAGIVHRDFKPANVIVERDNTARILDFGIALSSAELTTNEVQRLELDDPVDSAPDPTPPGPLGPLRSKEEVRVTAAGSILGTPGYMAPEQVVGERIDARTDQYSFFVSLHEALHGRRPDQDTEPRHELRRYPSGLRRTIARGLAEAPEDRWPDMQTVVRKLESLLGLRRRRRLALATAAVLVVPVGWAAGEVRSTVACQQEMAAIDHVWTRADRGSVRARIEQTELPFASGTADRVLERLDAHAAAWKRTRGATCSHSDPDVRRARELCLRTDLAAVEEVIDLLQTADGAIVERAVMVVADLPRPADCAQPSGPHVRASRLANASDPAATRDRALLSRADVQFGAGNLEQAMSLASEAQRSAARRGDAATEVAALATLGGFECTADMSEQAVGHLEQAYYQAVETGDDYVALRSAVDLSRLSAAGSTKDPDGWHRQAAALASRLEMSRVYEARLSANLGLRALREERFDDAERHLTESLVNYEASYGPDDVRLISVLTNLAATHLSRGRRFDESLALLERSRSLAKHNLGRLHPKTITAQLNYAAALATRGEYDRALVESLAGLDAAEVTFGEQSGSARAARQNLVEIHSSLGQLAQGRKWGRELLADMEAAGELDTRPGLDARLSVAQLEAELGDRERARAMLEAIATQLVALDDPGVRLSARVQEELGWLDLADGEFTLAASRFHLALRTEASSLGEHSAQVAETVLGQGVTAVEQGRTADALRHLRFGLEVPRHELARRKLGPVYEALREFLAEDCAELETLVRSDPALENGHGELSWSNLVDVALPCLLARDAGPDGATDPR